MEWDPAQALRQLTILFEPGQLFEIRIPKAVAKSMPKSAPVTASGVFSSAISAVNSLETILSMFTCTGVFFTLNPLDPSRVQPTNRIVAGPGKTPGDKDVLERRWLLVDCDPVRTKGTNSSQAELEHALKTCEGIRTWLSANGFPEPVELLSGNGGHLLYRVELSAADTDLVRRFLTALAVRFDDQYVKVDTSVANASRLGKVAGTLTRKGEHTAERPRRISRLLGNAATDAAFTAQVVSREAIESIIALVGPSAPTKQPERRSRSYTLAQLPKIEAQCAFMAHCRDDAASLSENHWWAQTGILARCEDGEELAHKRSKQYPAYSQAETGAKIDRSVVSPGPHTCKYIEKTLGFDGCASCPHHGKIKSPITLGTVALSPGKLLSATDLEDLGIQDPHGFLQLPLNDDGNASRFLSVCGEDLLYRAKGRSWLHWDKTRWQEVTDGAVLNLAVHAMRLFSEFVSTLIAETPELRGTLAPYQKIAVSCGDVKKLQAMLTLAAGRRTIDEEHLDADPNLFNVQNGTIDMRTQQLLPHDRAHRITKLATVTYDPNARPEVWDAHLERVFAGNKDLIGYLGRWAGYCLTGNIDARAFAVLYGSGCNGKSVTVEALANLMGDYACHSDPSTFEERQFGGAIRNDLARLRGVRMVVSSETSLGTRFDASLLKRLTGGEKITARFLHQENFDFLPSFKLVLATNNKPDLPGNDPAIWSRTKLIPFDVVIPAEEIDPALGMKLKSPENKSAILNSALKGYAEYLKVGLKDPPDVQAAIAEYREDQDFFSMWLESACLQSKSEDGTILSEEFRKLIASYTAWAEQNGAPKLNSKRFTALLRKLGFTHKKKRGQRAWVGLALRESLSPNSIQSVNLFEERWEKLERGHSSSEAA